HTQTHTTDHYTPSLHDALPISAAREHRHHRSSGTTRHRHVLPPPWPRPVRRRESRWRRGETCSPSRRARAANAILGVSLASAKADRKSTRLNSSHVKISYAVFC